MFFKNTRQFFQYKDIAAIGFLFSSGSLMLGVWAAALPFVKQRLNLSDADLGLVLLLAPLGSLCGVFLSVYLFAKITAGKWLGSGNIISVLLLAAEIMAPGKWWLGAFLFIRGLTGFLNGVCVNTVAGMLEKKHNRRFMSTCHAMYSIGGGLGAGFAALCFSLHIETNTQAIIMAITVGLVILLLEKYYRAHNYFIQSGTSLQLPGKSVVGLAFICLVLFMTEGCVLDWSSIYLKRDLQVPLYAISLGYAGFAIAMTIGRLNGDIIIPKLGEKKIVVAGVLLAAAGILLASIGSFTPLVIIGFVFTGFGCSCVVPVLFSASAKIPGVSAVQGFGMVTSGGLIGFVLGPSVIGFISEQLTLSLGFCFVFVILLFAAIAGWRNRFL
jgi:MFS family permease